MEEELVGAAEQDEQGLPTYASAAYPSRAVGYRFVQAGPFAMTLSAEGEEEVAEEMHELKFNKWLMAVQCTLGPLFCVAILFGASPLRDVSKHVN